MNEMAEYINKEDTIDIVSRMEEDNDGSVSDEYYRGYCAGIEQATAALENMPTESDSPANCWINVKDKLPERPPDTFHDGHWWFTPTVDVIVCDTERRVYEAHYTFGNDCFWYKNSLTPIDVTYWRPMPEPPKEDDDESLH